MFNVTFYKEDRRKLENLGFYFLESKNYIVMRTMRTDKTCFELIYDEISEEFIILTKDNMYLCCSFDTLELSFEEKECQLCFDMCPEKIICKEKILEMQSSGAFQKVYPWVKLGLMNFLKY